MHFEDAKTKIGTEKEKKLYLYYHNETPEYFILLCEVFNTDLIYYLLNLAL